jgi:two-component system, LytTR family, sensor kinase
VLGNYAPAEGVLVVGLGRRTRARHSVLGTDDQRVLVDVLALLDDSSDALGSALVTAHSQRAAAYVRRLLGTPVVAINDLAEVLAVDGAHQVDADLLMSVVAPVLVADRSRIVELGGALGPAAPQAIVTPLVVDGSVVGALTAAGGQADGGLLRLAEQVGRMVARQIEVSELHSAKTRLARAQLRALRAQMSPHFLFNALTAIAALVPDEPQRGSDLLLRFAEFTRYRLRNQQASVSLADELDATNTYLELERARFGERLEVSICIAPEVLPVAVPSLTIQPLVENALRHGLERRPGRARLWIRADDAGADAVVTVEDDGVGATPADVDAQLNDGGDGEHLGLANVDERLRLAFGPQYGLVVETAPGAGMKVSMRVPKSQVRAAS